LAFFVVAAGFTIWTGKAIIPAISGAVVEVVADTVFYVCSKTSNQTGAFHRRLERLQYIFLPTASARVCRSRSATRLVPT
jgi:hypothetical protein